MKSIIIYLLSILLITFQVVVEGPVAEQDIPAMEAALLTALLEVDVSLSTTYDEVIVTIVSPAECIGMDG